MLTAEYFVLDGALALAVPTKAGQAFLFNQEEGQLPQIHWQSFDHLGQCWFEAIFALNGECLQTSDASTAARLTQIFRAIHQLAGTPVCAPVRVEARLDRRDLKLRPGMEGVGKINAGEQSYAWIWTHRLSDWLRLQIWTWLP